MTFDETMRALEAAGTEQGRKIYRRHGAPDPMFGVSFAVLGQLCKKIKTDHALAQKLWASGNTDARTLATMIADPAAITSAELEQWAFQPESGHFSGLLARNLIVKTRFAHEKALAWIKSDRDGMAQTGWLLIAVGAGTAELFDDEELLALLSSIEARIHAESNGVREAMNYALIAIGVRNETCRTAALATAKRIGKVEVDHGETVCKTPDAAAYIMKTLAHRARKAAPKGRRVVRARN
jgi:3-methyladenine DNA glycosylase AlkD